MKTKILLAILSVAAILAISSVAPAMAGVLLCPANITGPVDGNVSVVAAGPPIPCVVTDTGSVDGNIFVEGAGTWLVMNGDLDGNVEAKECLFVVVRGTVDGNVKAESCNGSFFGFAIILPGWGPGMDLQTATINGNVEVKDADLFIGPGVVIEGNVKAEGSSACLISPLLTDGDPDNGEIYGNLEGNC